MKKLRRILSLVILGLTLFACNNQDSLVDDNSTLNIIDKENNYLSSNALKIGINSISIIKDNIMIESKPVKFNGSEYTLPNFKLETNKNMFKIILNENKSLSFDRMTKKVFIDFNGKVFNLLDIAKYDLSEIETREIISILVIGEDLFLKDITREKSKPLTMNKCGEWVYINTGSGRSSSDARLTRELEGVLKDNPNCSRLGGNDTSCLWENSACFTTAEISCEC